MIHLRLLSKLSNSEVREEEGNPAAVEVGSEGEVSKKSSKGTIVRLEKWTFRNLNRSQFGERKSKVSVATFRLGLIVLLHLLLLLDCVESSNRLLLMLREPRYFQLQSKLC